MKIDKTFKSNLISYKLLDDFILRVSRKLIKKNEPGLLSPRITKKDLNYASLNFKINTLEAIKLSKKNKIKEFFILSLPARSDYTKIMENKFFAHYNQRVSELLNESYTKFLNISNFDEKDKNLFCDYIHKTLSGNKLTAETLYKNLKSNSVFFN